MTGRKESVYFLEAEQLFVIRNRLPEEIASQLGLGLSTVHKWKKKGGWEAKRKAALTNPHNLAEQLTLALHNQMARLNIAEDFTSADADFVCKTLAAIRRIERQADPRATAITATEDFFNWLKMQEVSPEELQLFGARFRAWLRTLT
jgi:hypothetical protein